MSTGIFFFAVTVMLGCYAALPLLQRRQNWLPPQEPDRERQTLEAEKRSYLRAIQDIDFEHAAGKINAADHRELREHYKAEAARIIGRIESLGPGSETAAEPVLPSRHRSVAAPGAVAEPDAGLDATTDAAAGIAILREKLEQLEIRWEMGEIRNDAYFALRDTYRQELDSLADALQNRGGEQNRG